MVVRERAGRGDSAPTRPADWRKTEESSNSAPARSAEQESTRGEERKRDSNPVRERELKKGLLFQRVLSRERESGGEVLFRRTLTPAIVAKERAGERELLRRSPPLGERQKREAAPIQRVLQIKRAREEKRGRENLLQSETRSGTPCQPDAPC
jgi:hypothetical protein